MDANWQEYSMEAADEMGAFVEDALSEDDAVQSLFGVVDGVAEVYAASKSAE